MRKPAVTAARRVVVRSLANGRFGKTRPSLVGRHASDTPETPWMPDFCNAASIAKLNRAIRILVLYRPAASIRWFCASNRVNYAPRPRPRAPWCGGLSRLTRACIKTRPFRSGQAGRRTAIFGAPWVLARAGPAWCLSAAAGLAGPRYRPALPLTTSGRGFGPSPRRPEVPGARNRPFQSKSARSR